MEDLPQKKEADNTIVVETVSDENVAPEVEDIIEPQEPDEIVLGLKASKHLKVCYTLTMVAAGYGVLSNFMGLFGVGLPGGMIFGLIGLFGLALAMVDLFLFKESFREEYPSHFKYIGLIYAAMFVVYLLFVKLLSVFGVLAIFFAFIIASAQLLCLYLGFRVHKKDRELLRVLVLEEFFDIRDSIRKRFKDEDDFI